MSIHVKDGPKFREVISPHVYDNGAWRDCVEVYAHDGQRWKIVWGPVDAPVLVHSAKGKVTISNYDARLRYEITATRGSITQAGGALTLSDPNTVLRVGVRRSAAGQEASASCEFKAYTYTEEFYNCYNQSRDDTHSFCGNACPGGWWCGDYGAQGFGCCQVRQNKNPTPAGYRDEFGEWWRLL